MSNISHGIYKITQHGNTIEVVLSGAFNEFGAIDWTEAVKNIITTYQGKPFAILMDLTQAQGATPEAFDIGERYNEWLNTQNLVAKAVVYGSKVLKDIELSIAKAKKKQHIKNFDDIEQARIWLQSQF